MKNIWQKNQKTTNYLIGGLLFGLAFPIAGTLIHLISDELPITAANIWTLHRYNHLMQIIDLAPLVLMGYSYFLGKFASAKISLVEGERFRLLFDKSPHAHIMYDGQKIVDVNEATLKMFGCKEKSEIVGLHPSEISPKNQPDGAASQEKANLLIKTAFEQGGHTFEWRHRRKDDTDFPAEVTLTPTFYNNVQIIIAVISDLTIRKQQEKEIREYERFFRISLDLLCIANNDGFFKKINPRFTEVLGYSEDELLSKPFLEFVHPDDMQATLQEMETLALGKPTITFTNRYLTADGRYIWINWTSAPDSETGLLFAAARDVSDRMNAFIKLEEINKELDKFAYVVSHDLKAPLRAISSLASWIEEDNKANLNGETIANFELLKGRIARMENLINGILTYSRVGRTTAPRSSVNLNQLLSDIITDIAPPDGFVVTTQENLPVITANPVLIQQVFQNLISNAFKHHDKPTGTIAIGFTATPKQWEFFVKDNGPGIRPEYHEKVFEMFQTLASKDASDGTGIGLALVKKIIEDNGGKIWLDSAPGLGTTVKFTWPKQFAVLQ